MRLAWLIVALTLLALPALAQSTAFYAAPVVSVPKVDAAPRLDGIIEPNEWAPAAPLSPFVLVGGRAQPQRTTSVYVMYDDHNLYIAAVMADPNAANLKADATDRDGAVWEDDSFELFFDPDDQRKSYIHLAVNPKETQYDALMKDKSLDYRWQAEAATLADGWSVELQLPFANDVAPLAGVSWGFSAARHVASDGEVSSWDRKLKTFHELESFGSMVFAQHPLLPQVATLGALWLGDNMAQVLVQNTAPQAATAKANVRVLGRDKYGNFLGSAKLEIPANGRLNQNVPYSVYQDGFSTVALSVTDAAGKTVWRTSPYPVITPEVSPTIAAVEKTLGSATKLWAMLPQGQSKTDLQSHLDQLTAQWHYLIAQYRTRAGLTNADLETLAQFADRLWREAEMLEKEIKAAKLSGGVSPAFTIAAVPSIQHAFPETLQFEPGEGPTLDACRNETEALQVVVLPFR